VGNSVGLHPGLTLIAVIFGERISGLVGMIFAIPMMAGSTCWSAREYKSPCIIEDLNISSNRLYSAKASK
jgi:hypothetical protein